MPGNFIKIYLANLHALMQRGDAREESFYPSLKSLIENLAAELGKKQIDVTVLPKKTEAGNPDFRVWDGKLNIVGYIEAKQPQTNLDHIETTEQLQRYLTTFPNLILTDFYEFRLYRDGVLVDRVQAARPFVSQKLGQVPPVENAEDFLKLWQKFFDFSLPRLFRAESLAVELAKRTRFLRDLVYEEELQGNPQSEIHAFFDVFRDNLIHTLTEKQFSDLYAQTITYGLFAARTRAGKDFNRELAFKYIPKSIGILHDVFKFISLGELSEQMRVIVDDIAEVLNVSDIKNILQQYYEQAKGQDPILHFYETFLSKYDPEVRERRGVYYTPEPVVKYIVRAINTILKSHFGLNQGLASNNVKLLDPAAGTLTFPAKAIDFAVKEHTERWGKGDLTSWIKQHILENYFAFELMMAPYAIGHLKIGFILEDLGVELTENERFKLYLTNTLEMEEIRQQNLPFFRSLAEESRHAAQVKRQENILVILGNPPYSGISANINEWTEQLLKKDIVEGVHVQSYYKVDEQPLNEKKLWLQDDYVKFLRFAQWKIAQAGFGVVGMITNHSYLDNPTFRGMRQSLMKTFDEIYILNLHGNSLKKEKTPEGGKDENVFDIRQGVAIALFIKKKDGKGNARVFYRDLWGLREEKYDWLKQNMFDTKHYTEIQPQSPWYFFVPFDNQAFEQYRKWKKINEIFPVNVTGIVTARDNLAIDFERQKLKNKILMFKNLNLDDEIIKKSFKVKDNYQWKIKEQRKLIQNLTDINNYIKKILYRPFDIRYIFYQNNIVFRMRDNVMSHMLAGENLGLITPKQFKEQPGAFISENIVAHKTVSIYDINYLFPLYIYPDTTKSDLFADPTREREPNISQAVYDRLAEAYGVRPVPEEILYYVYAVLYSNTYRTKYRENLKIDFPRVPFTANYKLFKQMAKLGRQLAYLHLLKSPLLEEPASKFEGEGDNFTVEKIRYDAKNRQVYINPDKYFTGIYPELWNYYIGGYQVLGKWLKDRKGRELTSEEIRTYQKIATALHHTIGLQAEIDKIYEQVEEEVIFG